MPKDVNKDQRENKKSDLEIAEIAGSMTKFQLEILVLLEALIVELKKLNSKP